jgi:hypothetical protein
MFGAATITAAVFTHIQAFGQDCGEVDHWR